MRELHTLQKKRDQMCPQDTPLLVSILHSPFDSTLSQNITGENTTQPVNLGIKRLIIIHILDRENVSLHRQ